MSRHRAVVAVAAAVLAGLAGAGSASAHTQVLPAEAAPEDPVLFEVLVPDEREEVTSRLELAIPKDVIPFSFAPVPGWKRTTTEAPDGSLRTVVWKGRLPKGSFARFAFLASTPSKEGTITWKAIQTYADGTKVRWIGAPGSENPAATTRVAKDVPRQNAGGGSTGAPPESTRAKVAEKSDDKEDGGGRDGLTLALAVIGVLLGLAALGVGLNRRRGAEAGA